MKRTDTLTHVGRAEDFLPGSMTIITVGDREIGIVRQAQGTLHAILNRCPHKGAAICRGRIGGSMLPSRPSELIYGREGELLKCPWHGYEYDIETGVSPFGNTRTRLRKYFIEERDGNVFVQVEDAVTNAVNGCAS